MPTTSELRQDLRRVFEPEQANVLAHAFVEAFASQARVAEQMSVLPRLVLPCLLLAALGCGADAGAGAGAQAPFEVAPGCNPLAAEHDCLLPFPSDFFLVADQAPPSGACCSRSGSATRRCPTWPRT